MDGYSSDINIHQGYFPSKRYARIETQDFPEKFSIVSRLKKESFTVGSRGEVLKSSVLPQVQVKVPDGAVSSGTKITLQVSVRGLGPGEKSGTSTPEVAGSSAARTTKLEFLCRP